MQARLSRTQVMEALDVKMNGLAALMRFFAPVVIGGAMILATPSAALAQRLASLRVDAIVSSPLERCVETAQAVADTVGVPVTVDERFGECRYGEWTGRPLTELAKDDLWPVVQAYPSAARFPGGESLAETAHRAVSAVHSRLWAIAS